MSNKKSKGRAALEETTQTQRGRIQGQRRPKVRPEKEKQPGEKTAENNIRNITERKQAEEALRESEARFRIALENSPIVVFNQDRELRYTWVYNPHPGFDPQALLGKTDAELLPADDAARLTEIKRRVLETGVTAREEVKTTIGGQAFFYDLTVEPLRDLSGNIIGVTCVSVDITERKRAEDALRRSESSLQAVLQSTADGILAVGSENEVLYANEHFAKMWLIPQAIIASKDDSILLQYVLDQLIDPQSFLQKVQELYKSKEESFDTLYFKDGRVFERLSRPLMQEAELRGRVWSFRDITERKRAEEALRESEEKYRTILENIEEGYFEVDIAGNFTFFNESVCRLLGYSREEMMGMNNRYYTDKTNAQKLYRTFNEVYRTGAPAQGSDWELIRKDNTKRYVECSVSIRKNKSGQPIGFRGIVRDITERKQAEEALRQRLAELTTIHQGAQRLTELHTPESLAQEIVHILEESLGYEYGAVLMIAEGTDRLISFVLSDHGQGVEFLAQDKAYIESLDIYLGNGITGWVAENGQSVRLGDVRQDARYLAVRESTRSELCVPLRIGERVIGVVNVETTRPNAYSESDQRVLETIAAQIAIAIQNARLFEETHQRLAELEALHTVSAALRTAQTRDEALPNLLDETLAVMETEAGIIWLYHPDSDELRIAASRGWFQQLDEAPMKPGEGIAGAVFAGGQARVSAEFRNDPAARATTREQIPDGWGGACVPIRTGAITVGVLFVSVPLPHQITPGQVKLLESLAEMAGASLHRMSLHEETVRQLDQLQALHRVDQAIAASMDLRMTLSVLLEHVTSQLKVDAASVLLLNPHLQTLEYTAGRGFRTEALQHTHLRLGEGYAGRAALERKRIYIPDLRVRKTDFLRSPYFLAEGFVAYYGVPLIAKGQVKGVLEVFHRAPLEGDSTWLNFLETLAGQAAIAIDNTQLFDDLQRSNFDLSIAYDATIEGWSAALDLRDKETEGHSQRVTEMTMQLARSLGIGEAELVHVRRGALLHDIGKMGVPDSILLKPDKLTDEEWAIMRKHPQLAFDMLAPVTYLKPALDIPYCHHEKWDGTGYPRGLKGEQIPLAARIFAVVDVWDALNSDRPYRKAWSKAKALEYIREQSGQHFDPQVVEAFLQMQR